MTLVELLVVLLVTSILAAIAAPSYQRGIYQTRATRMVGDCQAIRAAAHMYRMDAHDWPADAEAGVVPPELAPYLGAIEFEGTGYELDWDRWEVPGETLVGISMVIDDPVLEAALVALASSFGPLWRVDNRYTLFIEGEEGFEEEESSNSGVGGGEGGGRWLNRGN
ncbi:MAG: hypothetical protein R6U63_13390 [Longimicrobiales bacterium]